jgi:hypothetical protein
MMETEDLASVRGRKIRYGFIGLDLRQVLILDDDLSLPHIPLQQFHLLDAFADVRELELMCHAPTSEGNHR